MGLKEIMNGKPGQRIPCPTGNGILAYVFLTVTDTLKGSYYANPVVDKPSLSQSEQVEYPEYYGQNICKYLHLSCVYAE
jgi:hypothetical protein